MACRLWWFPALLVQLWISVMQQAASLAPSSLLPWFPCNVCTLCRRLLKLRLWPEHHPLGQSQPVLRLVELIREENVISAVLQGLGGDREQWEPAGQFHGCQSSAHSATAPQFCCITSCLHGCSVHTKTGLAQTRACLQQILRHPLTACTETAKTEFVMYVFKLSALPLSSPQAPFGGCNLHCCVTVDGEAEAQRKEQPQAVQRQSPSNLKSFRKWTGLLLFRFFFI